MPRPQKNRKVCNPPKMQGYKPFGIAFCATEHVILQYDEYESIKLVNYNNISQEDAADSMNISRPTLTRIYNSALTKIAQAFVEGKSIIIEGGNIQFENDWYKCKKCYQVIEGVSNHIKCSNCNYQGTDELINLSQKD